MAKPGIAKLFGNGRSQVVRLPQGFRFEGDRVRIRGVAEGVLIANPLPTKTGIHKPLEVSHSFNQSRLWRMTSSSLPSQFACR
jgi:virulence-associated protein VagC